MPLPYRGVKAEPTEMAVSCRLAREAHRLTRQTGLSKWVLDRESEKDFFSQRVGSPRRLPRLPRIDPDGQDDMDVQLRGLARSGYRRHLSR